MFLKLWNKGTRIKSPTSAITIRNPDGCSFSHFTIRMLDDSVLSALGQVGVGIALSMRAGCALLKWIPSNSRVCTARLDGSVHVNNSRLKHRCVFVTFLYVTTDCSSPGAKNLFRLLRRTRPTDIVVGVVDFNVQPGYLTETKWHIEDRFSVPADSTDNSDRPQVFFRPQVSSGKHRPLSRKLTWCPPYLL